MRSYFSVFVLLLPMAGMAIAADADPAEGRRYTIGVRVQYFLQQQLFETHDASLSTTSPIADYNYSATTRPPKTILTPCFEYRLTPHLTIGTEFLLHQAQYTQEEEMRSGKKDPNASTDDREVNTTTERTRANYWEFPVLLRYYNLSQTGLLSKAYVVGGLGFRHIGKVRSGTEFSFADDTTAYHETPATPKLRQQFGPVVGIGLRFVDDYNIKVEPEIRFTRWQGHTFEGTSFRSASNELRVGLGISF